MYEITHLVGTAAVEEVPGCPVGDFAAWAEDAAMGSVSSGIAGSVEARRLIERLLNAFLTLLNARLMLARREGG
jgi:hypothetical protein